MSHTVPLWKRPTAITVALVLVIAGLAVGTWLIRPLFVDQVVDEAFPVETETPGPVATEAVEEAEEAEPTATAVTTGTDPTTPTAASPDRIVVLTGMFSGADSAHEGAGDATVYQLASGRQVLRFESFDVTNGPDLHVLLVPLASPATSDDVHSDGYVDLGKLKGNQGDQNYDLPDSVNLSSGEWSVVIYCDPFSVIFATASLSG